MSVAESVDVVDMGIEAVPLSFVSEVGSADVSDLDIGELSFLIAVRIH